MNQRPSELSNLMFATDQVHHGKPRAASGLTGTLGKEIWDKMAVPTDRGPKCL